MNHQSMRRWESPSGDVYIFEHPNPNERRITLYPFKGNAVHYMRVMGGWQYGGSDGRGYNAPPDVNSVLHQRWAMYEDVLATNFEAK